MRGGYIWIVKGLLTDALVAVQFLTVAPALLRRSVTPRELGNSVAYFPLVGLLIGLLLFGLQRLLQAVFPAAVGAAILLGVWILCSGALHFDGFVDAVDGLLGGRTTDDRLRILRDEGVGAFAVAAGGTLLLLKFGSLGVIGTKPVALIAAPLLGRWVISAAVVLCPYARAEGLGRAMKENSDWRHFVGASAFTAAALVVLAPPAGIVAMAAAVVAAGLGAWLLIRFTLGRIPGLTGDIYGALCEVTEALCLVTLVAHWPL